MAKASEELKNRILCYINSYTEQHGFAPSYREIQAAVGVGSTSTIYNYVKRLETEKRLNTQSRQPRTISTSRSRTIEMRGRGTRRVRVETSDGGALYLDCSLERSGASNVAFAFTGVIDASHLKSAVSSAVSCSVEEGE